MTCLTMSPPWRLPARDEAPTISRAIRSVAALADEIVVGVDTATVDDTARIAAAEGARVVELPFSTEMRGDFAAAHNVLNRLARDSWRT